MISIPTSASGEKIKGAKSESCHAVLSAEPQERKVRIRVEVEVALRLDIPDRSVLYRASSIFIPYQAHRGSHSEMSEAAQPARIPAPKQ